jgi:glyoxylase-like metal-dependent hydrolase (beta-lactamase superfamily II)
MNPDIQHFYEPQSGTFSYVVSDPATNCAAIIDPVLGFSLATGRTDPEQADAIAAWVDEKSLSVEWILETHAHADHLSAAQRLKSRFGGQVAIGQGIRSVQENFGRLFNLGPPFAADGRQFDRLFADGDTFALGELEVRVMDTPGHTNDSVTYLIGNAAFVGDTVFMTDFGTARCDFPGGDAGQLYDSVQKLFALPDDTILYLCHDYPPSERAPRHAVPVTEQRADNVHINASVTREDFIRMRNERDATLKPPGLVLPSLQVNVRAGHLPEPEDNATVYLRIPVDTI